MVWKIDGPQGNEAKKCRADAVPYAARGGLDIGCGGNKIFPHFIGIDNRKDVELFGANFVPDLVVDDASSLHIFSDGSHACVFSSHTLEHIDDYKAALREWWRVVAIGGYLVLYLPHRDLYPRIGSVGANPDHKHDFAPDDIIDAMREIAGGGCDIEVNDEKRDEGNEYSFFQVYKKLAPGAGWLESYARPKPEKTIAFVRPGAYGDAIWSSTLTSTAKRAGYHVTLYTGKCGAEVCAHDPNVDRLIELHSLAFESDIDWQLFYLWESRKYDRLCNLIGTVETDLLPHPEDTRYWWPRNVRRARMGRNYLEAMHEIAELPTDKYEQHFYPSAAEHAWATTQRKKLFDGPLVIVAPTGSGQPKTWPHVKRFAELMAARRVHTVIVGELRVPFDPPGRYCTIIGKDLQIRHAMALAQVADVVVGEESAILNSVANAPPIKVALLSHSSPENLTKHWTNTIAIEPTAIACHPCHRLHRGFDFCLRDTETKFAACQAAISAELVADSIAPYLDALQTEREAA